MAAQTNIRVDLVDSRRVPCGMNSIVYLGNDINKAVKSYNETPTGVDQWHKPNKGWGVILSIWGGSEYIIKREKGLDYV